MDVHRELGHRAERDGERRSQGDPKAQGHTSSGDRIERGAVREPASRTRPASGIAQFRNVGELTREQRGDAYFVSMPADVGM